jgi:hypothetical protein
MKLKLEDSRRWGVGEMQPQRQSYQTENVTHPRVSCFFTNINASSSTYLAIKYILRTTVLEINFVVGDRICAIAVGSYLFYNIGV